MEEDRIADEYKKNNEKRFQNLLTKINVFHLISVGVIVAILISMSKNSTDPKYNYIGYAVLIGTILVLYFKPPEGKKLLPDYIVKEIAQEALNRKVRIGKEFSFDSKVIVTPYCHLISENDMTTGKSGYVSWDVGFEELVSGSQYKKTGVISIHPHDGFITGIKSMTFGYDGTQSHNKDIVPVGVVMGNFKTTDFGGQPK